MGIGLLIGLAGQVFGSRRLVIAGIVVVCLAGICLPLVRFQTEDNPAPPPVNPNSTVP